MSAEESKVDSPELVDELIKGKALKAPALDPIRLVDQIVHRSRAGAGLGFDVLESLIGENDLVQINYLERGMMAARTVCRMNVPATFGERSEWGTGFLIAPGLLLTNNHVLDTAEKALRTTLEFGYELNSDGALRRTTRFRLRPELGFVTSPRAELDYTIVAVAEQSEDGLTKLTDLGYLRLDCRTNKVDVGHFVTIIQHPESGTKRISLRENKVVKLGDASDEKRDNFLWYSSDTAPGSSGAPVCTDAWQVVCLHHASVPDRRVVDGEEHWVLVDGTTAESRDARRLPMEKVRWLANEGVRTSQLLKDLAHRVKADPTLRTAAIAALVDDAMGVKAFAGTVAGQSVIGPSILSAAPTFLAAVDEVVGKPKRNTRPPGYFNGRSGYDPAFLPIAVPLPTVGPSALRFGAVCPVAGTANNALDYLHFSVVFNGDPRRKIAFFTAVNIDGKRWTKLDRGNDKWFYDPRIPEELQNGDELYGSEPVPSKNYFDRGHLVRRLDPVWGDIRAAKQANDDTFYWTNCSPQYWGFNQGADLWQGLENFLLYNTNEEDVRASVFSGPVFSEHDEEHRGILIPQSFWKVICVCDRGGQLFSSGYIVSQQEYALDIPFERMPIGPNSAEPGQNFQVPVRRIEEVTGLIFDNAVRGADVYTGPPTGRTVRSIADIQHPRR